MEAVKAEVAETKAMETANLAEVVRTDAMGAVPYSFCKISSYSIVYLRMTSDVFAKSSVHEIYV